MLDGADAYKRIMKPVMAGDISALEELAETEEGFPDGQDPWLGRHWLTNAIDCGSPKVVRWMLEKGAPPVYRDDEGYSPLHSVIERRDADRHEMMAILIEFGADVNAHGVNDWTPVHMAAAHNDLEALRILHAAHADFSVRTSIDNFLTPLEEARVLGASPEVIARLEQITRGDRSE